MGDNRVSPRSNEKLLAIYENAIVNKPNLLNKLQVRQEYVEHREGAEGGAIVSWPNGTKDVYELKFSGVRHVGKLESNEFESDTVDNPWVEYEIESQENSTDSGRSERSPVSAIDEVTFNEGEQNTKPHQRISAFRPVNESLPFSGIKPNQNKISQSAQGGRLKESGVKISGTLDFTVDDGKGKVTKQTKILYFKDK